jgi:hypothetical protein
MFGRKKKGRDDVDATDLDSAQDVEVEEVDEVDEVDGTADDTTGPWSIDDLDGDRESIAEGRLDLGSVLLMLPAGGQLQVEMTQAGAPQAVHIVTPNGRITVAAFAAPKSPGQWRDVAAELADTLRRDNARVATETGPWGREVVGSAAGGDLRFIGVDGYRWMIRGVASGPAGSVEAGSPLVEQARAVVAATVVDRGSDPHPVRTPLPISLPPALAQQLAAAQQQQLAAAQAQARASVQQQVPQQQVPQQQVPQQQAPDVDAATEAQRRRGPSGSAMQQLD